MVNFAKLGQQAKKMVDKRGGTEALKGDLNELKDVAKGKGSLKDKAKAAGDALKDPGAKPAAKAAEPQAPAPAETAQDLPPRA